MSEKGQAHRSGALKQTNKAHKHGKHKSKGSLNVLNKGKVSVKTLSKKQNTELNRIERRNQSVQIRKNKRDEVLMKKRGIGGLENAPFLVSIVPLHKYVDANSVLNILNNCDKEITHNLSSSGVTHLSIPRFKQRFSFVVPSIENDFNILDTVKVSDTILFVLSAAAGLDFGNALTDEWGHNILQSVFGQGLPTPTVVVTDINKIPPKKQNDHKQKIQKFVTKWLPEEKIVVLEKDTDGINLLRKIGNQKRRHVGFRDRRPHMYPEHSEFVLNEEGVLGTLKVTGYLRGTSLSVNSLVHIPGLGDFQMSEIDAPVDPLAQKKKDKKNSMETEDGVRLMKVLEREDPSKQESLESEVPIDPMDADQTWPTDEEIKMAEEEQKVKLVKRVPKGWSDYQAAWIPEGDTELAQDDSDDEEEDGKHIAAISREISDEMDGGEFDEVEESDVAADDRKYDEEMDIYNEQEDYRKLKAAKDEILYPDEVETPQDTPAKVRFQKYRGLASFRTSPWNPEENLTEDYGRIFRFRNFDLTKKRILKEQKEVEGVMPGSYIAIHVKNVPKQLWENFKETGAPLIVFGMFPYEHKMSVMNVVLKRTPNYDIPIKSKERLIFQCGYRRFIVNPIFSQHTNGNKHKMERYFQPESIVVATFYAPIQFPPAPVLCYKEINGKLVLVATGSLLSCNPDRIILKRTALSGHLFKVHKHSAVVRFMFFNREDIRYFKPCCLRTKYGRNGRIKEPLGTHGHMKCVFDGPIKSQDTVMLNLYKRVFPKWTYEECIVRVKKDQMQS